MAKNITQLDNPYLYLLGRENLAAQIEAIQQQNIIYPISYYQAKTQIAELVKLVDETDKLKINIFQYKNPQVFRLKLNHKKFNFGNWRVVWIYIIVFNFTIY